MRNRSFAICAHAFFQPQKNNWRTFCSSKAVRTLLIFLLGGLVLTNATAAGPLSTKEIALMLRSGYSSDSVLKEIASRRVLDTLDPATKKSILEFGASPPLINALETNAYLVSASEADQAKQRAADVALRRTAEIEQDRKRNTLYQAQQAQARAKAAAAQPASDRPILDALKEKLVRCRDGTISRVDGADLEKKKFIALYYSAHWCAPCRKFTPELVDYYNRVAPAHPEFEIIFVSSDRSRFGWETYLRETKMPWLAIDYDQLGDMAGLKQLGGAGIPSLLVLDKSSHIVASSYDGDKYLGPQNALAALERIFAQKATAPIAQAR
jgi:nucleoredoxin